MPGQTRMVLPGGTPWIASVNESKLTLFGKQVPTATVAPNAGAALTRANRTHTSATTLKRSFIPFSFFLELRVDKAEPRRDGYDVLVVACGAISYQGLAGLVRKFSWVAHGEDAHCAKVFTLACPLANPLVNWRQGQWGTFPARSSVRNVSFRSPR